MDRRSSEKKDDGVEEFVVAAAAADDSHPSDSSDSGQGLSREHRDYLYARHGTVDLHPLPDPSDADPYNWPQWKKTVNLVLVAFHAFMALFSASAIIPAYEYIAQDLHVSVQRASYLTSVQIALLCMPIFWKPVSRVYGIRPVLLVSLVGALVCNIGAANSPNYASMIACRALSAAFISPPVGIGSAVVTDTFFKEQRARYMGVWTLMVTIGVPVAPFLCGFVVYRVDYRWIYYILAITHGVQLVLYFFLGPESRYIRGSRESVTGGKYLSLRRIDPAPFTVTEIVRPFFLFGSASAFVPAAGYAMVFLFTSVMTTVEIPQLFVPKFGLNPQQIGLQFLALIIGSVLGEQIGGWSSDAWMAMRSRRLGQRAAPEFRIWLAYFGYVLAIAGTIVFLLQIENATTGVWNVTPIVGAAISAAGNQIVTTVLVTYVVDCHPDRSADVGVFITTVRQVWAFIGPFWLPDMFANVGLRGSTGIAVALMVAVSIVPTALLHMFRGSRKVDIVNA